MLTPDALFSTCNALAVLGWLALAAAGLAPRLRPMAWPAAGIALPLLFALVYVGSIAAAFAGNAAGGFGSLGALRSLFSDDHALLAGWVHYLAFDLIVGTLIARDAAKRGVSAFLTLPFLALTFLFGPAGLLAYAVVRVAGGKPLLEDVS